METEKQLYHPFTYPPICAQDYGRAPSLITCSHLCFYERDSEVIFTQRILRIGLPPSPTLYVFSARLLSSSQSLDFLHIDCTTNILKCQEIYYKNRFECKNNAFCVKNRMYSDYKSEKL